MIYLYAYTNHKADLDHLRRMGALWKLLDAEGIDAELLVNDYRAQLAAREMGLPLATTIETIRDIDAVAQHGDSVVIDSPEEAGERMGLYAEKFARLVRLVPCGAKSLYGEKVVDPFDPASWLIDPALGTFRGGEKSPRKLLVYRDSDPEKELLKERAFFEGLGLELYWGNYFYVKYEEVLAESFGTIHESEEYSDLITSSALIVTAMPQTALEAAAAGAAVIYLMRGNEPACLAERFDRLGIARVPMGERPLLERAMESAVEAELPLGDFRGFWPGILLEE